MTSATDFGDEYQKLTFSIGETNFVVQKMLAMEGFEVLEQIRAALGEKLASIQPGTGIASMISAIALSIPPADVSIIRNKLFAHIAFTNKAAQTPMKLQGNIDCAFEGLEAVNVYEVFLRCLVINFFSSFSDMMLRLETTTLSPSPPTAT